MRASRESGAAEDTDWFSGVAAWRRYRLPLPPHPIAAEQARILVRLACADWGIGDGIDAALLIAVELTTNAMKIGEVFEITVSRQGGAVLIEVWDGSEAAPDQPAAVRGTRGRPRPAPGRGVFEGLGLAAGAARRQDRLGGVRHPGCLRRTGREKV